MTISEAIASQGYDEPAKVEPARPDLAAIAGHIDRVRNHAGEESLWPLRMCGVPALLDDAEALLDEVARLTRERDEARRWARASMKLILDERDDDQSDDVQNAFAVLASWDAEAEVKP